MKKVLQPGGLIIGLLSCSSLFVSLLQRIRHAITNSKLSYPGNGFPFPGREKRQLQDQTSMLSLINREIFHGEFPKMFSLFRGMQSVFFCSATSIL